jgi:hypothetical protein
MFNHPKYIYVIIAKPHKGSEQAGENAEPGLGFFMF